MQARNHLGNECLNFCFICKIELQGSPSDEKINGQRVVTNRNFLKYRHWKPFVSQSISPAV